MLIYTLDIYIIYRPELCPDHGKLLKEVDSG